ncbi:MAG TPA: HD domain-containing phosphohydrolase, partial [Miltoncostaeaceae bacterium]|nr:HD domain-containing phosphohydrolase [Miltoncostaeaceae bacterium]
PGGDGPVGAVEVWTRPGDAGDASAAQALLDLVATVAGGAFDAHLAERAHAAELGRARRLEAAAVAVREAREPRSAVQRVLAEARALVGAPCAALLAAGAPSPEVAAYDGLEPLSPGDLALLVTPALGEGLAGGAAWGGPLPGDSVLHRQGLRTAALVPVGPAASLGVLAAFWEADGDVPEGDLVALAALAGHAASALTATVLQQEIRDLGVVDPLTRFFNERYFTGRLEQECQRALRAGTPVSVAVMAVDGVADLRAAGRRHVAEAVIEALAAHVTERLRGMDVGCRLGEDELAAILPEVEGLDALRVGERLRASTAAAPGLGDGVTLSVGVASFPAQAGRADTLVAHARDALQWARDHGGDRTFLYTADSADILRAESRERAADDEAVLTTVATLAAGVDAKHPATARHHENVGRVAALLAAELGLAPDAVEDVRVAGLIHDVGKIGLDDEVLAADGDLPEPARSDLRRHPEIGERMLAGSRLENVAPWLRHHHERMDGAGYPDGLAGEAIPLESRILAVADAWDHLRSGRWGGVRLAPADVMKELERRSGPEFDPVAVAALRALVGRGAAEAPRVP